MARAGQCQAFKGMIQAFFPVLRLAYWYFTAYAVLFCFIPFS